MIFGVNSLWIWGAVIILSVVVETFTLSLCAIWFAVGGLAALVAASLKLNVLSQLVIFVLFSAALARTRAADLPPDTAYKECPHERRPHHR